MIVPKSPNGANRSGIFHFRNLLRKSPGVKIGNETVFITFSRRKSFVSQVISASGLALMALARMGASLVGRTL